MPLIFPILFKRLSENTFGEERFPSLVNIVQYLTLGTKDRPEKSGKKINSMAKLTKDSNIGGVLATGNEALRVAAGRTVGGAAGVEVADGFPGFAGELVEEGDEDEEVFELWLRRPNIVPSTTARTRTTRTVITPTIIRCFRCLCNSLVDCA